MNEREALAQNLTIIVRHHLKHDLPFAKLRPKTRSIYILYLARIRQVDLAKFFHCTTQNIEYHIAKGKLTYPTDLR